MQPAHPLWTALDRLIDWQSINKGHTSGWCLKAVRYGFKTTSLRLPLSWINFPGNLAISCGRRLARDPARWGWKLLGSSGKNLPTDQPSLVFFDACGELPDGRLAGHVGIYKPTTRRIIANYNQNLTPYWRDRIAYVFAPLIKP